jgi:uncharacterized membrane protein YfcA
VDRRAQLPGAQLHARHDAPGDGVLFYHSSCPSPAWRAWPRLPGFLAGLLGIGGGMIMVPFISAILSGRGVEPGLAVKMAIATSMATIIFTSVSSVRAHHKKGAVRWDIVKALAPGIVLGAMVASLGVFALLKGASLYFVFAAFVAFSGSQMFLDKKPRPRASCRARRGCWARAG